MPGAEPSVIVWSCWYVRGDRLQIPEPVCFCPNVKIMWSPHSGHYSCPFLVFCFSYSGHQVFQFCDSELVPKIYVYVGISLCWDILESHKKLNHLIGHILYMLCDIREYYSVVNCQLFSWFVFKVICKLMLNI